MPKQLLNEDETREFLGIDAEPFAQLVESGHLPRPAICYGSELWSRLELERRLEEGCPIVDTKKYDEWTDARVVALQEKRAKLGINA